MNQPTATAVRKFARPATVDDWTLADRDSSLVQLYRGRSLTTVQFRIPNGRQLRPSRAEVREGFDPLGTARQRSSAQWPMSCRC